MIRKAIELLGGPYDGAPGLYLTADDEQEETPFEILVGTCRGRGMCGMSACAGNRGSHVAFWLGEDEDDDPPVRTLKYVKADEEQASRSVGRVSYVFADLEVPGALEGMASAGAGALGGMRYG